MFFNDFVIGFLLFSTRSREKICPSRINKNYGEIGQKLWSKFFYILTILFEVEDKMKKVYLIGDSLSKSITCKNNHYTKGEFDVVKTLQENFEIQIENYSQIGQTLSRIVKRYDEIFEKIDNSLKSLSMNCDKYFVVELGGNDCDYYWEQVILSPNSFHHTKTPFDMFFKELKDIVIKAKNRGLKPIFLLTPPIVAERYFDLLSAKFNKDKVLEFLNYDITNIYRHQECYIINILKLAKVLNIKTIDLRSEFLLKKDFNEYISEDGIHPNEKGYKFIYDIIATKLVDSCKSAVI